MEHTHSIADPASVEPEPAGARDLLSRSPDDLRHGATELTAETARLRRRIADLQKRCTLYEGALADGEAQRSALMKELEALRSSHQEFLNSTLWRALHPLRASVSRLPPSVRRFLRRAVKLVWWTVTLQLASRWQARRNAKSEQNAVPPPELLPRAVESDPYETWVALYDTITDGDREAIGEAIEAMSRRPLISVVMPVYDAPEPYLRAAIESVVTQLYPNWELCIADDASLSADIRRVLEEFEASDERIKVCYRSENGHISAASNSALALATGDYIALLDHDDVLPEHALYVVAAAIAEDPTIDLLFSDEDKIDGEGRRFDPYFKSDWNSDLMLGQNMFSHLGVYRRKLIEDIGGFRLGYEGAQDHDLTLRASARTTPGRIKHIPHILYHWRAASGSTAAGLENKSYAPDNARKAIIDHLAENGIAAWVTPSPIPVFHRVHYPMPHPFPLVSLIVPTRDRVELLRVCIDGLLHETDYPNLEVIIVDNESRDPATLAYFREIAADNRVRVLQVKGEFNFSALNNRAAEHAQGEILGLINNDIEVIEPGWLQEMVSHASRPGIGAVGAKLYYPNETIQHAGVILGLGGVAGHPYIGCARGDHVYFGRAALTQNLSAVTGACLIIPKAVYNDVGGLDEINLAVAFNDIDLCLRLREKGYLIVWTPFAELYHHESASRGDDFAPDKIKRFQDECSYMERSWGNLLQIDPYYNLNHSLALPGFQLALPRRVPKPWQRR